MKWKEGTTRKMNRYLNYRKELEYLNTLNTKTNVFWKVSMNQNNIFVETVYCCIGSKKSQRKI